MTLHRFYGYDNQVKRVMFYSMLDNEPGIVAKLH